jgi:hypothetical protein
MDSKIVSYGLEYAGILIEAALVLYVAWSSQWKSQRGIALYPSSLLVAELGRAYALRQYGLGSRQYFYVYWSTDFLLVISAFLLVCLFFRRACLHEEKMWRFIRLLLAFIFVLVLGISGLSISRNHNDLFTYFIIEFNQNLYFTCLVLNTLLYILLEQVKSTDDKLGLLVCGVGIQFAGPAATLALLNLATGASEHFARSLTSLIIPLCTLGMLVVWAYAIVRVEGRATEVTRRKAPVLAEVTADLNV